MALSGHYRVIERFPEIQQIKTSHTIHGETLWHKTRLTYRKKYDPCAICGQAVDSPAYVPLTHKLNRNHRICTACGDGTK